MNVLNRLLGAAAGKQKNGESPPSSGVSTRESLWQKASSLRQSLRGRSSRHEGGPGASSSSSRRPASLYLADSSSSRCSKSRQSLRREWGSQRDLSRDKRHAISPSAHSNAVPQQQQQQQSGETGSDQEADRAWSSTWTLPDSAPLPPKQRSPRKLTKDSGYETSGGGAHGEPDYVNREWVARVPSPPPPPLPPPPSSSGGHTSSLSSSSGGATSGTASGPPSIGATSPAVGGSTSWTAGQGSPGAGARDACREAGDGGGSPRSCFAAGESLRSPGGAPLPAPGSGDDDDMVTRRFKKGTVYSALASQSGLDFSPVVLQPTRPSWGERAQAGGAEDDTRVPPPPPPPLKERKPVPVPSHEKYPSWPVTPSTTATSTSCRSKSWTQETDYPKEKAQGYARPKKGFKISTQQLQPVLERACEPGARKSGPSSVCDDSGCISGANEACLSSDLSKATDCSADAYLSKYDEFLRQYQRWSEAPFLQRLYQEGERDGWPRTTEAPLSESACDSLGSSGGSSQDTLKWHGSYSDLSAFSASNGSSLFDSGHSTLPDSGRLSPQSSCDGSLADGSQRLVSPSQAAVARSARVLQPKRHESESVLYYAPSEAQRKPQHSCRPSESSRVAQLKAAFDPACSPSSQSSRKEPQRLLFLDPEKKHRVSDPELKAIQKQAVLSFYKRQTSQDSSKNSSGRNNRTLPRIPSSTKWSVAVSEPTPSQSPPSLTTTVNSVACVRSAEVKEKPEAPWKGPRSWSVPDITQQLSVAPKSPWGPVVSTTCKTLSEVSSRRSCDGVSLSRTPSVNCRSSADLPPVKKQLSVAVPKDSPQGSPSSELSLSGSKTSKFVSPSHSVVTGSDQQVAQEDHAQIEAEVKDDVSAESRRDSHSLRPSVSGGRKAQLREVRLQDRSTPALQLLTSEGVTLAVAPASSQAAGGPGPEQRDSVVDMVPQISKPFVDRRAQDKLLDRVPEKLLESRVANGGSNNNNNGNSPVLVTQHGRRSDTTSAPPGPKEVTPVHLALHHRGNDRSQDRGDSSAAQDRIHTPRSSGSPRSRDTKMPDERYPEVAENTRCSQPARKSQDKIFDRAQEKGLDVRIQEPARDADLLLEGGANSSAPRFPAPPPAVPPRRSPTNPKPPPRPPPKGSAGASAAAAPDENGVDDESELQRITDRIASHVTLARTDAPCPGDAELLRPETVGRVALSASDVSAPAALRPVSWTSLCSSPELPLPSPPPFPPANREGDPCSLPAEDDEPLPPPPEDLEHVAQQQQQLGSAAVQEGDPADPRVYPKNSYMWYRTERKPGRQGFQGNYRRSYHGGGGGETADSGPDSCPGSDQGSELTSEEASSESSSSSCPSSPLSFPPHSWPSPGGPAQPVTATAASQDAAKTTPLRCERTDSLNNNNNSNASVNSSTTTAGGGSSVSINSFNNNNNNALSPSTTGGGDQASTSPVACNGCCDQWPPASVANNAASAGTGSRRTNSATQTGPDEEWGVVQLRRGATKSQEELECERLSQDFASRYGDAALRSLLVPSPNQKTTSDYLEGLFDVDASQNGQLDSLPRRRSSVATSPQPSPPPAASPYLLPTTGNNALRDENLPANSAYYTTSESKAKFLTRFGSDIGKQEWSSDSELAAKKDELMASISRKLDVLRSARLGLREEAAQNEQLGRTLGSRVEQLARPAERDKYRLHVDELDKIVSLILSLSGRLARVHNALAGLAGADEPTTQERRALEAKRDKLSSQHEEARRLKESIDRRSRQVAQFLRKYLTPQEYADYDHFVRMKSKLLVDAREIDDKIRLGEEQLAALRAGTVATTAASWRSLASS
ncbi:shroom isoform X2 [Amblyomma americanum]